MAKVPAIFVRSAFNYDMMEASDAAGLKCDPAEGRAQQQFKEECDINEIVRRFGITGEFPQDFKAPVSGDFTGVVDFQTAMNAVVAAEREFMSLPGELRARFDNSPQKLMHFMEDGRNLEEARRLGLVKPAPGKDRAGVPVEAVKEEPKK